MNAEQLEKEKEKIKELQEQIEKMKQIIIEQERILSDLIFVDELDDSEEENN